MAEIKRNPSQVSTLKRVAMQEIRRLLRAFARLLPRRISLIFAGRSPRRSARHVTKFEVGGNITRSIILALPNVHFDSNSLFKFFGGVLIVIIVITVASTMTPNAGKNAPPQFERGDPFHLDAVIAPLQLTNAGDKSCGKFAQDYADRLTHAVVNNDPSSVVIWEPAQVANAYAQEIANDANTLQFARARQVDVLFYGEVECDDQKAILRPRVYASDLFYQAAPEMAGFTDFDDLMDSMQIDLDNVSLEQAAREHAARLSNLIDIGRGIRLAAKQTSNELGKASELFQRTILANSISDRRGLAMLWYLLGKAQLAGAIDECNNVGTEQLQQAETSFSKSLLHEPEFALAHAFLGNTSVYLARHMPSAAVNEVRDLLNKGLSRFQRAQDARVQPANGLAAAMSAIGEAQINIALHDLDPAGDENQQLLADAADRLDQVVRTFDHAGAAPEIKAVLAIAYALTGDLKNAGFKQEQALSAYGKVASLTENRRLNTAVAQSMAELYSVRGDACAAAQKFLSAAQTSCPDDRRKFAMQAEQLRFYCQRLNDAQIR